MKELSAYLGLAAVAVLAATILPGSSEALPTALLIQRPDEVWQAFLGGDGREHGGRRPELAARAIPHAVRRAKLVPRICGSGRTRFGLVPEIRDLAAPLLLGADRRRPPDGGCGFLRIHFVPFVVLVGLGKAARYAAVIGVVEAIRSRF